MSRWKCWHTLGSFGLYRQRFDPEVAFKSSRATHELAGRCERSHLQQVKRPLAGRDSAAKRPNLSAAWKLLPHFRYSEVSNQNPPPGSRRFLVDSGDSMQQEIVILHQRPRRMVRPLLEARADPNHIKKSAKGVRQDLEFVVSQQLFGSACNHVSQANLSRHGSQR